jgi:hypothetical protein
LPAALPLLAAGLAAWGLAGATQEIETTGSGLSKSSDRCGKAAAISKR